MKKTNKLCIIILLLLSSMPFLFNIVKQDNKKSENLLLSASNSLEFKWSCKWGTYFDDVGWDLTIDSSDNVYLTGATGYIDPTDNISLVKFNGDGVQQWNCTWDLNEFEVGRGIAMDSTDNVYVVGSTGGLDIDMVLVKYDSFGNQLWNRLWNNSDSDYGWGVAVDSSDNVYLAGSTRSSIGYIDMLLVKYDSFGNQLWNRTWGGVDHDEAIGVAIDSSDNVYLTGFTFSFGAGQSDIELVKYNENGIKLWNRTWGGNDLDDSYGVVIDSSDDVYLTGYTDSFGAGWSDMVLVKYNKNGIKLWNYTWGGVGNDEGRGLAVDLSNNVYIVGVTEGKPVIVQYNSSGVLIWNYTSVFSQTSFTSVAVDSLDNLYIVGTKDNDMLLVKFGEKGEEGEEEPAIFGYDLFFLCISVIGGSTIVYLISLKKIYKKFK